MPRRRPARILALALFLGAGFADAADKLLVTIPSEGWTPVVFSPGGARVAYRVEDKSRVVSWTLEDVHDGVVVVPRMPIYWTPWILDGKPIGPEYDEVRDVAFSPDGAKIAYSATREHKWYVVVDGREFPTLMDEAGCVTWGSDGASIAYTGRLNGKWLVVLNQVVQNDGWGMVKCQLSVSPDGRNVAFWGMPSKSELTGTARELAARSGDPVSQALAAANPKKRWTVSGSGKTQVAVGRAVYGAEYEEAQSPVLGPGGRLAYQARKAGRWLVVVDGKEFGAEFESATNPRFLKDGRLAYFARAAGGGKIVIEAKRRLIHDAPHDGLLSPDGRKVAVQDKSGRLVIGKCASEVYERIERPVFVADGTSVSFGGRKGRELWHGAIRCP